MYGSLFPRDLFAELDRLQREMQQAFDLSPTIRGFGRSGFPALNVGGTPQAVEVYAFAPGLDPATLEINVDRGVLTISGERKSPLPEEGNTNGKQPVVHINERFAGQFTRVLTLPDEVDPDGVKAQYRDGIVQITIPRHASAQPRRITVS
jgi:HSP20 family protein